MAQTLVQHKLGEVTTSGTTSSVTVTATGSGNLLVAACVANNTRTVTSVTDGTTNFTQVPSARAASGTRSVDFWYLFPSAAGKTAIPVQFSGAASTDERVIQVWEVSGFTTPKVDATAIVNNGTSAASTDTGAAVTNSATAFIAAMCEPAGSITVSPKAGNEFTSGGDIAASSTDAGCSLVNASVATHTPAWTDASGLTFSASTVAFIETPASTFVPFDCAHTRQHQGLMAQ